MPKRTRILHRLLFLSEATPKVGKNLQRIHNDQRTSEQVVGPRASEVPEQMIMILLDKGTKVK